MDPVPKQTVFNFLQMIDRKPITYENAFPLKNMILLLENQVKYVEDIIVTIEIANLEMTRRGVIQVKSELGQAE